MIKSLQRTTSVILRKPKSDAVPRSASTSAEARYPSVRDPVGPLFDTSSSSTRTTLTPPLGLLLSPDPPSVTLSTLHQINVDNSMRNCDDRYVKAGGDPLFQLLGSTTERVSVAMFYDNFIKTIYLEQRWSEFHLLISPVCKYITRDKKLWTGMDDVAIGILNHLAVLPSNNKTKILAHAINNNMLMMQIQDSWYTIGGKQFSAYASVTIYCHIYDKEIKIVYVEEVGSFKEFTQVVAAYLVTDRLEGGDALTKFMEDSTYRSKQYIISKIRKWYPTVVLCTQ